MMEKKNLKKKLKSLKHKSRNPNIWEEKEKVVKEAEQEVEQKMIATKVVREAMMKKQMMELPQVKRQKRKRKEAEQEVEQVEQAKVKVVQEVVTEVKNSMI